MFFKPERSAGLLAEGGPHPDGLLHRRMQTSGKNTGKRGMWARGAGGTTCFSRYDDTAL